ncbi:MAG: metallophosphoesterase [Muribaculaceae bacterium]|nr:metallophosphoesterase [Muribaculaceae bacterium]
MLFAMSDIHGCRNAFIKRLHDLNDLESVKAGKDKLILLGDYIDRGAESYTVLKTVYDMQQECGSDNIIVLRGNHEEWFIEFLEKKNEDWLGEDENLNTSKTFLTGEQMAEVKNLAVKEKAGKVYDFIRQCIRDNHKELLRWMKKLPYYYATDTQIFVHAGVDEEAGDWWEVGTPDYYFVGKYPPTFGEFYMDVIAGHTATASIAGDKDFHDVFYDGGNHYFIDGGVERSGSIPILVYDERKKKYYSLQGSLKNGRMRRLV